MFIAPCAKGHSTFRGIKISQDIWILLYIEPLASIVQVWITLNKNSPLWELACPDNNNNQAQAMYLLSRRRKMANRRTGWMKLNLGKEAMQPGKNTNATTNFFTNGSSKKEREKKRSQSKTCARTFKVILTKERVRKWWWQRSNSDSIIARS